MWSKTRKLNRPLARAASRLGVHRLFENLDALRFGAPPFLPKLRFVPGKAELAKQVFQNSPVFAGLKLPASEVDLGSLDRPDQL